MLEKVKLLLGIPGADDALLQEIISTAENRLKLKLGGLEAVPSELSYIVTEVAIIRYNRISSEGAASQSRDGESTTYLEDDFAPFAADIAAWNNQHRKTGVVRFL